MYYRFTDGWFTYYINKVTGEKKLHLDAGDEVVGWQMVVFCGIKYE